MTILKVNRLAAVLVVLGTVLLSGQSFAQTAASDASKSKKQVSAPAKQLQPQTTCPVYGGDIDKSQFVDINGKRIYVCCAACIADIKKDPDKYIKKLEAQGQGVESIPNDSKTTVPAPKKTTKMDHSTMKH